MSKFRTLDPLGFGFGRRYSISSRPIEISAVQPVLVLGGPISSKTTVLNLVRSHARVCVVAREVPDWLREPAFNEVDFQRYDLNEFDSFVKQNQARRFLSATTSVSDPVGLRALVAAEEKLTTFRKVSTATLACLDKRSLKTVLEKAGVATPKLASGNYRAKQIWKPRISSGPSSWSGDQPSSDGFFEEFIPGPEYSVLAWVQSAATSVVAALAKTVVKKEGKVISHEYRALVQEDGTLMSGGIYPRIRETRITAETLASACGIGGGFFTFDLVEASEGDFVIDVGPGTDSGAVELLDSCGISCGRIEAEALLRGVDNVPSSFFVSSLPRGSEISSKRTFVTKRAVGVESDRISVVY